MDETSSKSASTSSSTTQSLKVSPVDDAAEVEDVQVYEGVGASDFSEFSEMVEVRLDGIFAASVVLVFTVMVCAGVLAVSTLFRSLEG